MYKVATGTVWSICGKEGVKNLLNLMKYILNKIQENERKVVQDSNQALSNVW